MNRLVRALLIPAGLIVALPVAQIVRSLADILRAHTLAGLLGMALALVAICFGALFFAVSIRYYFATLVVILLGESAGRRLGALPPGSEGPWNGGWRPAAGSEPFVCVQIAAYNETKVIERLLEACSRFTYPNYEVILCDDSTDPAVLEILERWRDRPGFKILHRTVRTGFKGGALRGALAAMDPRTEYVLILDADALPFPDTIERFLPRFFERAGEGWRPRERTAAIQSYQWHVLNKDEGFITNGVRAEYAGSYMIERVLEQLTGGMRMIAGTAYMIRAGVLRELGWGTSITEDFELTLRLYEAGYKVGYTPYAEVPAECVGTFRLLVRQRMRWAEGHTHQIRRHFWSVLRSPRITVGEKLEFLYYGPYYLLSIPLLAGTLCWVASDFVLHTRLPEWTSLMGWSLVGANLLALPLMNVGGLLLEGAPAADAAGVVGACLLGLLLAPFQGYAALKGLIEPQEGGWFRTPKSGHTTGSVAHLPRLPGLKQQLHYAAATAPAAAVPVSPAGRGGGSRSGPNRWAWLPILVVLGLTGALFAGSGALRPQPVYANPVAFYLHGSGTSYTMDSTVPTAGGLKFSMNTPGQSQTWASTATYPAGSVIPAGTWTFNYWITANGSDSLTALQAIGYSADGCATQVPIDGWTQNYTNGNAQVSTSTTAYATTLPAGGPYVLCWTVTVVTISAKQTISLSYDSALKQTNLGTPTIVVPDRSLPFAWLALLIPPGVLALRRRGQVRS